MFFSKESIEPSPDVEVILSVAPISLLLSIMFLSPLPVVFSFRLKPIPFSVITSLKTG